MVVVASNFGKVPTEISTTSNVVNLVLWLKQRHLPNNNYLWKWWRWRGIDSWNFIAWWVSIREWFENQPSAQQSLFIVLRRFLAFVHSPSGSKSPRPGCLLHLPNDWLKSCNPTGALAPSPKKMHTNQEVVLKGMRAHRVRCLEIPWLGFWIQESAIGMFSDPDRKTHISPTNKTDFRHKKDWWSFIHSFIPS